MLFQVNSLNTIFQLYFHKRTAKVLDIHFLSPNTPCVKIPSVAVAVIPRQPYYARVVLSPPRQAGRKEEESPSMKHTAVNWHDLRSQSV